MRFYMMLVGVLVAASPAIAQNAPPSPAPEKKVCRMITPIGSIMGKRFCLTKTEWQQLKDINEVSAQTALDRRLAGHPDD